MSRWRAFFLVIAATLSAEAEEVVRFRVDYQAPQECPDARAFASGVTGRTDLARIQPGEDSALVEVELETQSGNEGRVRITGKGREPVERSVRGGSCAEIVDALALITALQFDPEASSEARPEKEPEPTPRAPIPTAPPAPRQDSLSWSFAAAVGAVPWDSTLPGPDLGFFASLGASSEGRLFAPKAFVYSRRISGDVARGVGRAEFSILSFGLVGCPIRAPVRGSLLFRPCAGFELGALSAEGVDLTLEKRQTRLWLAPALSGRGEWEFAPPFVASAAVGSSFPLLRQHYFFESGEKVHDIPRVSFNLSLEIGVNLR